MTEARSCGASELERRSCDRLRARREPDVATGEPENLLTVWADLLMATLARAGVQDLVVSPGSRSTPFVLAAARRAELRLRSVIDERSAAFFALGLSRVTGLPTALLCTSGTAPAHYFPAVVEASEAAVPLVVLSADRPTALIGIGAPQTIDQAHLYGSHVRAFVDLGDPTSLALPDLAGHVARTVARARGPVPGPVHLNARASKPLEPREATSAAGRELAARAAALLESFEGSERLRLREPTPATAEPSARERGGARDELVAHIGEPAPDRLSEIAARLNAAERPMIVAGPLPLGAPRECVLKLAARTGIAVFAEATSQLRFARRPSELLCADAFDLWVGEAGLDGPDVVLEVGWTPTSAAYARWLDRAGPRHRFVLGGCRYRDPSGTADAVVLGELGPMVTELLERIAPRAPNPRWCEQVNALERRAWRAVRAALDPRDGASDEDPLQEGAAVRAVVESLPDGALLALGNSLPIRHVDRFVPGGATDLRVLAQRGVNGIDGWIASAAGAAAADGGPTAAILGDVAFSHDLGSLALAASVRAPLVLVVLDNGGGRIFEQLPIAQAGLEDETMALFTSPPRVDVVEAARAFGIDAEAPADEEALRETLRDALARDRATVLHLRVPPHGAVAVEARVRAAWRAG